MNFIVTNEAEELLLYETCINVITFFFEVGGCLWSLLGVIRLSMTLHYKDSPALQGGIWQIFGGFAVVVAAMLFRVANFDFEFLIEILKYAGIIVRCVSFFWIIFGLIHLFEGTGKDPKAPGMETGIWQIVGGVMIFVASYLFNNLISVA